jgi:hypothetical protein
MQAAIRHYNANQFQFLATQQIGSYRPATLGCDQLFLMRITLNFLRHMCSNYDELLSERVGSEKYSQVRDNIEDAIYQKYPWLNEVV